MANRTLLTTIALTFLLTLQTAEAQQHQSKTAPAEKKPLPRSSVCLDLVEKAEGEHQPELKIAPKLIDLGDAYKREGATMEAVPVYERALTAYKKAKQSSSPRALDCQIALADLFDDSGRYDKSAQVYSEALANAAASEHYQLEILPILASVMVKAGKLQQAEPIFKHALTVTEKHYGQNDQHVAQVLQPYADLLNKLNRQPEASKLATRAQTILKKKVSNTTPAH